MKHAATIRPRTLRRRLSLVLRAGRTLARLEVSIRRQPLPHLCTSRGISFTGFEPPPRPTRTSLPRHVAEAWWSVDVVLRGWPWGRRRRCLRRGLAVGKLVPYASPALTLEVVRREPLEMHAVLTAGGHRLDLGPLDVRAASQVTPT